MQNVTETEGGKIRKRGTWHRAWKQSIHHTYSNLRKRDGIGERQYLKGNSREPSRIAESQNSEIQGAQ